MSDQQQASQQFEIQKIYLKDVSLETPNSPMIFTEQWQPQTEVRLETGAKPLAEGLFEVSLTVTITAKNEADAKKAIDQAENAFKHWRSANPILRANVLTYAANLMRARRDELRGVGAVGKECGGRGFGTIIEHQIDAADRAVRSVKGRCAGNA